MLPPFVELIFLLTSSILPLVGQEKAGRITDLVYRYLEEYLEGQSEFKAGWAVATTVDEKVALLESLRAKLVIQPPPATP